MWFSSGVLTQIRPDHRKPLIIAAVAHVFVIWSLAAKGVEWGTVSFIACAAVVFVIGVLGALASVRAQVRSALETHTWDELLITRLTDREIVNGQLWAALRPAAVVAVMMLPVMIIILLARGWAMLWEFAWPQLILNTVSLAVLFAMAHAVAAVLILCLAVLSFSLALSSRGWAQRIAAALIFILCLCLFPVLVFFCLPLALLLPAMCWYHHRVLCCTLRTRVLEGR